MNYYEVLFVINPKLEDDKKDAAVERVKEVISSEGKVVNEDIWGLRRLAYPIQKMNEGYYGVIQFEAEPTLPKELDRRLRISDDFIRHIIVTVDEKLVAEGRTFRPAKTQDVPAYVREEKPEVEEVVEEEIIIEEVVEDEAQEVETVVDTAPQETPEEGIESAEAETESTEEVGTPEEKAEAEPEAETVEAE